MVNRKCIRINKKDADYVYIFSCMSHCFHDTSCYGHVHIATGPPVMKWRIGFLYMYKYLQRGTWHASLRMWCNMQQQWPMGIDLMALLHELRNTERRLNAPWALSILLLPRIWAFGVRDLTQNCCHLVGRERGRSKCICVYWMVCEGIGSIANCSGWPDLRNNSGHRIRNESAIRIHLLANCQTIFPGLSAESRLGQKLAWFPIDWEMQEETIEREHVFNAFDGIQFHLNASTCLLPARLYLSIHSSRFQFLFTQQQW